MTGPSVEDVGRQLATVLRSRFDGVYVNPVGTVIVPFGNTYVSVVAEPVGDLHLVTMRAPILQGLSATPQLFRHVALQATMFKLGALYLFEEGDGLDLEFETRTFTHWVPLEDVPDILPIVGNTAEDQAGELQPLFGGSVPYPDGGAPRHLFAEEAMARNRVVADALDAALDTQRTAILGAAQGAWLDPGQDVLGQVVFTMTATDLWLAGWTRDATRPAVWRFPYRDLAEDQVRRLDGATDYLVRRTDGRWLGVRMLDPEAADAMVAVRRDPSPYLG